MDKKKPEILKLYKEALKGNKEASDELDNCDREGSDTTELDRDEARSAGYMDGLCAAYRILTGKELTEGR